MKIAKHGKGEKIYLVRFHYLRPGAWDAPSQPPSNPARRRPVTIG